MIPSRLKETIQALPQGFGVYLLKDSRGKIIYIGKAVCLRKRVSSHFTSSVSDPRHRALVSSVGKITCRQTPSELAAIFLEGKLIKKHQPRYNVLWRDDKAYPYLKITIQEQFPRFLTVRRKLSDGAIYLGPFEGKEPSRRLFTLARRLFPLRSCKETPLKRRKQPCLDFYLRRCSAPCLEKISSRDYRVLVRQMILLLEGKLTPLVKSLKKQMEIASRRRHFEQAAYFRDKLFFLERFHQRYDLWDDTIPFAASSVALTELQGRLSLPSLPDKIVGFDVSHTTGYATVASMVSFSGGKPDKKRYRRFLIRGPITPGDDLAALKEVVSRYTRRLKQEGKLPPDLILIDGGRGQIKAVRSVLQEEGLGKISLVALAKKEERIYFPDGRSSRWPREAASLRLLIFIRDEAHRFAVSFHRRRRRGEFLASKLEGIAGLGEDKKKRLLAHFGSLVSMGKASRSQLQRVKGIGPCLAGKIEAFLKVRKR